VPYRVRKQGCAKSDGGSGTHVVQKKSGGKWSKASCHSSEEKAKSAIRARGMNEDDEDITGEGKIMKITKRQLRRLIRESLLREADTSVYEGDHDPIRIEIPALEKIAPEENFDGEKVWFSDSDASKIAEMLEDGPPDIERYDYDEEQYEEAEAKWDELIEVLGDGWYDEEREELAKNIRDGIKQAEDAGYSY